MAENLYARAASAWVAKRLSVEPDRVSDVDFKIIYGGYCETCGYETFGLDFKLDGKFQELELGTTSVGEFLEEATEILKELK